MALVVVLLRLVSLSEKYARVIIVLLAEGVFRKDDDSNAQAH